MLNCLDRITASLALFDTTGSRCLLVGVADRVEEKIKHINTQSSEHLRTVLASLPVRQLTASWLANRPAS